MLETQFIDLTEDIRDLVAELEVANGMVVIYSRHTTAGIKINEAEPLLLEDLVRLVHRWAPPGGGYAHDDFDIRTVNMTPDERPNGHSHCQQLLFNTSETIPIANGELLLGEWQSVFLVELDGPREREVLVQVWSA